MKFRSVAKKFAPRINLSHAVPVLAAAPLFAFADGSGGIDVSTVVALIATGAGAVALIGGAKMGVNGVIVLWNKVSAALGTR